MAFVVAAAAVVAAVAAVAVVAVDAVDAAVAAEGLCTVPGATRGAVVLQSKLWRRHQDRLSSLTCTVPAAVAAAVPVRVAHARVRLLPVTATSHLRPITDVAESPFVVPVYIYI